MGWEAWLTLTTVLVIIVALMRNAAGPDIILLGGLAILMTGGVFSDRLPSPAEAVAGFGNEGLVTVAVLFVVVTGLTQTGAMAIITQPLLGRPRQIVTAQARLMLPIAGLSAFLNNTPIVAMFMPVVSDWCKKTGFSPSKLFIPLSYAAILGGTCTLIGTSTNLVVNGMLLADPDTPGMSMFEIGKVGLPVTLVGIGYVLLVSRWLLPDRKAAISVSDDVRQYMVEMMVEPGSPLIGQTIEQAGLRQLPGLYLAEIDRDDQIISAVAPTERLRGNDRLVFVGVVESVVDLQKLRGLKPATKQVFKLDAPRAQHTLIEAVVSDSCPLIGKTIRDGRFRTRYDAVVIAAARNGERIRKKIGDIVLQSGDTLLLEAHPSFVDRQRNSRDFYLISRVDDAALPRHELAWIALTILLAMVGVVTAGWMSMLNAAMLAALLMIVTRCCSRSSARRSIDLRVLLVIGAALGIGKAMDQSGAAQTVAGNLVEMASGSPLVALIAVYFVTSLFTEFITNNAAAVLVFPIAKATALSMDVNFMPFVVAVMIAASASFITPIGYQTNLMVYGPGGYRFSDYVRIGLPLNAVVMAITIVLAPIFWPF